MRARRLIVVGSLITVLAACLTARNATDAPVALPADYVAREAANMDPADRCGPAFIQDHVPAGLISVMGPVIDGPFRPVCRRHDACYRLNEHTQSWCDDRMRDEMLAICDLQAGSGAYRVPGIGLSLCRFHAGVYYAAINNTYGAYAHIGQPGGEITGVRSRVIDDAITDDEFTVCVDVANTTDIVQEYDVEMHTEDGVRVDREPDTYETNVRAGESAEFCVGTNATPLWSLKDLSDTVYVSIRADTPENFAFTNDMVIVDSIAVAVRPSATP
ncbi:hypothetical protein [Hyphomonas johnsonii]|jgi:hypothetical protein|uniref:Lipoprotein n=1 Tax=Hyphomonas johnsonii MHS-2 TaxID=1280950 RepID=A0A059FQ59_9PROT|nr:hypothetical protein [Hyphomonas johnsonii]KCZ92757.1 hypothetical protein HJO_07377 [Hyphomonas johnsonii MHS-2]